MSTEYTLTNVLDRKQDLGVAEVPWLKQQLAQYPWCGVYHILLAKAYYNEDSFLKNKHLRNAAMYAGNRETLFNFLRNSEKEQENTIPKKATNTFEEVETIIEKVAQNSEVEPQILPEIEKKQEPSLASAEVAIHESIQPENAVPLEEEEITASEAQEPNIVGEVENIEPTGILTVEEVLSPESKEEGWPDTETQNEIGEIPEKKKFVPISEIEKSVEKPAINFDEIVTYDPLKELIPKEQEKRPERRDIPLDVVKYNPLLELEKIAKEREDAEKTGERDFLYWLNHAGEKEAENTNDKPNSPEAVQSLLDQFLATKRHRPIINRSFYNAESKAVESETDNLDVISETLVALYVKQGLWDKAILGYEKLSLQNPDKSAYFAARITEVKEKQQSLEK